MPVREEEVLATPFGILSSIYINEYAPASRLAHAVRFVAKLLTGIPSIISGVFAYAVVVLTTGGFSARLITIEHLPTGAPASAGPDPHWPVE